MLSLTKKQLSKDSWDATTSREAFENYAIAATTAVNSRPNGCYWFK